MRFNRSFDGRLKQGFRSIWKYRMQRFSWWACTIRVKGTNMECLRYKRLGGEGASGSPVLFFRVRTTRRYMSNNQTLRPACSKPVESKIMEDRIGGS